MDSIARCTHASVWAVLVCAAALHAGAALGAPAAAATNAAPPAAAAGPLQPPAAATVTTLAGVPWGAGPHQQSAGALLEPHPVLFDPFLTDLEQRTFRFFWETANPTNGLIPDRYPTPSFASIAAVGFGLTAYPIGIERHYISRAAGRERVLATLRFFAAARHEHGFFYHYIDMQSRARANDSEISTVDTSLLLAGVLFCQSYFDSRNPHEVEIRRLADKI
jgi:hypothetical protein